MKSYKEMLNEWAQQTDLLHEMTEEERSLIQKKLLMMYGDIKTLCKENGLTIVLGGGSCLGAIRHKGMIPWDDDLDLNMARADYNKLIKLLKEGALSDKYEFRYPDGKMYSSSAFLKIYLKGTVFAGIGGSKNPYPSELFIDIFPIEGTPSFAPWRKLKGYTANVLRLISNCVCEKQFESEVFMQALKEQPELLKFIKKRHILGSLFSFLDYRTWMHLFDMFVEDERLTPIVTVPTGRNLYNGECIESSKLFPTVEVPFENITAEVYGNYDAYLKLMYGDYMQVPPVDKRESHFIAEFKL